jgi:hypothetical protein
MPTIVTADCSEASGTAIKESAKMELDDTVPTSLSSTGLVPASDAMTPSEEALVTCYEDSIPELVAPDLLRLYGSLFSSYAHLQGCGDLKNVTTYVAHKGNTITSVFIFRQQGGEVHVLNEVIKLDGEEVAQFARHIFTRIPTVTCIRFHAVMPELETFPFPYHRCYYTDDIVLDLPSTPQDYLARLGKATRKNIKHHLSQLWRTMPNAKKEVYQGTQIRPEHVHAIVGLNRKRMAAKNKVSSITDSEAERIIKLVHSCGLVSMVTMDGHVAGGAICCRTGDNYFSIVNAHDPAYDGFRLGTLCCFLLICECISRGGKEFHFLWGRYDYKYKLLGVRRSLEDVTIYRSQMQMLLNAVPVLRDSMRGNMQKLRFRLREELKKNRSAAQTLAKIANHVRPKL